MALARIDVGLRRQGMLVAASIVEQRGPAVLRLAPRTARMTDEDRCRLLADLLRRVAAEDGDDR